MTTVVVLFNLQEGVDPPNTKSGPGPLIFQMSVV